MSCFEKQHEDNTDDYVWEKCDMCRHLMLNGRNLHFGSSVINDIKQKYPNIPLHSYYFNGKHSVNDDEYNNIDEYQTNLHTLPHTVLKETKKNFKKYDFHSLRVCKRCRARCAKNIDEWWFFASGCPCQENNYRGCKQNIYFGCFMEFNFGNMKTPFLQSKMIVCSENQNELTTYNPRYLSCCNNCTNYWAYSSIIKLYLEGRILENNSEYDVND